MIYRETNAWQRFAATALQQTIRESAHRSPGCRPNRADECAKAAADFADAMWLEMRDRDTVELDLNAQRKGEAR